MNLRLQPTNCSGPAPLVKQSPLLLPLLLPATLLLPRVPQPTSWAFSLRSSEPGLGRQMVPTRPATSSSVLASLTRAMLSRSFTFVTYLSWMISWLAW